jgi:hypothetical protein
MTLLTMEETIKAVTHGSYIKNLLWDKDFVHAVFFTDEFVGGMMEIKNGVFVVTRSFKNQEEMTNMVEWFCS